MRKVYTLGENVPAKSAFRSSVPCTSILGIILGSAALFAASCPSHAGDVTTLMSGNDTIGEYINGGLILSGSTLYATAQQGGVNGDGTVFSLPIAGGSPTVLASFNVSDGSFPQGGLNLYDGTLYGATKLGGLNAEGNVFSLPITAARPPIWHHSNPVGMVVKIPVVSFSPGTSCMALPRLAVTMTKAKFFQCPLPGAAPPY